MRVCVPGLAVGAPAALLLDGVATPFQYTGEQDDFGAEIFLALSFAEGQARTLEFIAADRCTMTDLSPVEMAVGGRVALGRPGQHLVLDLSCDAEGRVGGPLGDCFGFPVHCHIVTTRALEDVTLTPSVRVFLAAGYHQVR